MAATYRDAANAARRNLRLGEHFGVVAKIALGDTFEEAFDYAVQTAGFWYQNIFQKFWFNEGYRVPSDPPQRPLLLADERALTHDGLIWESWGQSMPFKDWDGVQRYQMETFAKEVMPAFR